MSGDTLLEETTMTDTPFGRQPQKVTVCIYGDPKDVEFWAGHLSRAAEYKGDDVQRNVVDDRSIFVIHPRAVND